MKNKLSRMKNVLIITCCLVLFALTQSIADSNPITSETQILQVENTPQKSSSSVVGGILIIVSIGIGFISRKIYETRSKNQEEI
jgi:hypothetical protein